MSVHVRAGRKYKLSFEIFHPSLSPSSGYFRRVSSLISAPSSSQFTKYSILPYQRRYSPPLLYGNHFRRDFLASTALVKPSPTLRNDTSCHRRRKRSLSPVRIPIFASATSPS